MKSLTVLKSSFTIVTEINMIWTRPVVACTKIKTINTKMKLIQFYFYIHHGSPTEFDFTAFIPFPS